MNQGEVISIMQQALYMVIILSAPMLIIGMVVGIAVSIFQAATQIHEQTLAFVPKIISIFVTLIIFGPWLLKQIVTFTEKLFSSIERIVM